MPEKKTAKKKVVICIIAAVIVTLLACLLIRKANASHIQGKGAIDSAQSLISCM